MVNVKQFYEFMMIGLMCTCFILKMLTQHKKYECSVITCFSLLENTEYLTVSVSKTNGW